MKKIPVLLAALFLTIAVGAQPGPGAPKGKVDTRGLDRYIAIAEDIQNGKKIPQAQWEKLLETPVFYLAINKMGFMTADGVKKDMQAVYQKGSTATEADGFLIKRHLEYKAMLPKLKAYSANIQKSDYRKALQKHLYPAIPKRLQYDSLIPPVVISWYPVLEANGLEDMILQDAIGSYYCDSIAPGVLTAHEAVHSLFTKSLKSRTKIPLAETDPLYSAVALLSGIAQEGLADLIDKEILSVPGSPLMEVLAMIVSAEPTAVPATIKGLDSVLQAVGAGNKMGSFKNIRAAVMQFAGHIPGRAMARAIRSAGMLPELIADADNPFPFFYAYNKAVAKLQNGMPVLSETSITVLKGLEEQLVKPL